MNTAITVELLEKDGWIKGDDPVYPMSKKIENRNPINSDPEDTDIELVVHRLFNIDQFAVAMPDGSFLNFNVASMEELKAFENAINFYDCPY